MFPKNDLTLLFFTTVYVVVSILVPVFLVERKKLSKYWARKAVHSFSGLAVFVVPYLAVPFLAVVLSSLVTMLMFVSGEKSFLKVLFKNLAEKEELSLGYLQGPFAYSFAITLLMLLTTLLEGRSYFAIAALMVMIFADTLASIVGKKHGTHKINIPFIGNKRSVEGSLTFFLVGFCVSFITYYFIGYLFPGYTFALGLSTVVFYSLLTSFIGMVFELFSPSKWDDLLIPLGTTLALVLLF